MESFTSSQRGEFERVAGAIIRHAGDLLQTGVSVVDDHGTVIASNLPLPNGRSQPRDAGPDSVIVRVPVCLDSISAEVLVEEPPAGEAPVSPRLARALVDLVVNQVTVVDQLPNHVEMRNAFIYDLLHGVMLDEPASLRQARLFGMDLSPPRAVLLIDASDYLQCPAEGDTPPSPAELRRRTHLVVASIVGFFNLPDQTICASDGAGEIAILKASDSKNLETWIDPVGDPQPGSASWANLAALKRAGQALLHRLRHDTHADITIGIGRYHPGIPGLARSYADARAALALGRRLFGQNEVHSLDGLGIASFVGLADHQTKLDLAAHLLSPLDHEAALLETLHVFFAEDQCPSTAAARLGIHRNTLGYRLDKIASFTGLDPRRFDDAVQVRLALVLRSLDERPS